MDVFFTLQYLIFSFFMYIVIGTEVTVHTSSLVAKTDDIWSCVTLDHWPDTKCDFGSCQWLNDSLHNIDLENEKLRSAVSAFNGKIRIRLGGTLADSVLYDVGVSHSSCIPFSPYNVSYRWGYKIFSGCLKMGRWDALNQFCSDLNCTLLFGVNGLYGRSYNGRCPQDTDCVNTSPHPFCCTDWSGSWDSSMANDFFAYSAAKGHKIYAYEFGNELTGTNGIEAHISAQQYAQDFIVFADLVRMYFGQVGKVPGAPRLVTPDGTFNATYLNTFLDLLPDGYKPDILTHHLYSLGAGNSPSCGRFALTPSKLDKMFTTAAQVNATIAAHSPTSDAWMGEAGGAYDSGRNGVTNAFNSPFWYLDQMAIFAAGGHKAYCRQTLVGGWYGLLNVTGFEPTPDYYALLLWSRLMGSSVLSAQVTNGTPGYVRVYSHCSQAGASNYLGASSSGGAVTVLVINLQNTSTAVLDLSFPQLGLTAEVVKSLVREEYIFTSAGGPVISSLLSSHSVLLNGELLETLDNKIPPLRPNLVDAGADNPPVSFPLYSYGFIVFPTVYAPICDSVVPDPDPIQSPTVEPSVSTPVAADGSQNAPKWLSIGISSGVVLLLAVGIFLACKLGRRDPELKYAYAGINAEGDPSDAPSGSAAKLISDP